MTTIAACALLISTVAAQVPAPGPSDDRRDVVELAGGREVRGRVATPFATDEIVVMQGGKRVRVAKKRVVAMTTVNDHLREILALHADAPRQDVGRQWFLAEQAAAKGLQSMAALFAYAVLDLDPGHEAAHRLVGHRRGGDVWLWRRDDRYLPRAEFDEFIADWGHPLELPSEHWWLRTDAGVGRAVDTLLDLERLYLFVFDHFGVKLDLHEVLRPMPVFVWRQRDAFPGWTDERTPYYQPPMQAVGEGCYSWMDAQSGRAAALFRLGTEAMLNRCLAVDATNTGPGDRLVDWFEIGFGQWIASQLAGAPGLAAARAPELAAERARLVRDERHYSLPNLLTRNVEDHYYGSINDHREHDWALAEAFVGFLMANAAGDDTRDRLLHYAWLAMRKKRGDSSSTFDKAMGRRIESFAAPFTAWLDGKATPAAAIR